MLDLARWKRVGNDGVEGARRADCMSDMADEWCLEGSSSRVNSGQKECESTMGEISRGDPPTSRPLTRVAPPSADHPHAAEPYPPDQCERNLACALVVAVVRLERKVERHGELRVRQDAAARRVRSLFGAAAAATYWSTATGSSPQPALSFPPFALASPACGVQCRRPSGGAGGAGGGLDVAIGRVAGAAGAATDTRRGGTAMAGVCCGGWERAGRGERGPSEAYYLVSY